MTRFTSVMLAINSLGAGINLSSAITHPRLAPWPLLAGIVNLAIAVLYLIPDP